MMLITLLITGMALFEVALSDGSDLVAEEMSFELGWNSTSTTKLI